MPRYVIERDLPGAGKIDREGLRAIASRSCDVLDEMGPSIQWLHSYVTDDRLYCVYDAPDEAAIREHARRGPFPVTRILPVHHTLRPRCVEELAQEPAKA